ncbi:MAG: hypothetical protein OJF49_004103 [Ktedonobacterales bacterium]|jgi:hypothetical protein|nr:MAG: hypothetical protein OJF49_004103 [Ktedonobacterales bacterium]
MSSHREAPEIANDPVADNTDVYAFVSPDRTDTVTIIANYIPLEEPAGGPNFFQFGDDVVYEINIDNDGDGIENITYQFRFQTKISNPETFLYNTGQITSLNSPNWNVRQFYSVTKIKNGATRLLSSGLASPPCRIGPSSTPNYPALAQAAVHRLTSGETVFAGQRAEGFYVDLGAIFDLATLRPFQNLHIFPMPAEPGVNTSKGFNVHTIALQIPKNQLTRDGAMPTDPKAPRSIIGIYASASRRKGVIRNGAQGPDTESGPWVQVSRLGNPLFNEVIVPIGDKDRWNALDPKDDSQFLKYVQHPELAGLLPVLYPGVFPNLAALTAVRADLVAILLTGIPAGLIPGFQNFTGPTPADLLRLNMAIPPSSSPNILGLLGGDLAGFPNGRRVFDDVVTIELRAIAGVTYPLINPAFKPDAASSVITDGLTPKDNNVPFLTSFPYLGVPNEGFNNPT